MVIVSGKGKALNVEHPALGPGGPESSRFVAMVWDKPLTYSSRERPGPRIIDPGFLLVNSTSARHRLGWVMLS